MLLIGCAIFLVLAVIGLGNLYFRLHALPEHLAHGKANKLQFEIVSVLALLALFTHNNWFWAAALLLALVPIPDFHAPLAGMANSLARMARREPPGAEALRPPARQETAESPPPAEGPPPSAVMSGDGHGHTASAGGASGQPRQGGEGIKP